MSTKSLRDDTVGYRNPPEHSRFQKGQSGNPRGRPRRSASPGDDSRSIDALILSEADRPVTVREADDVRQIPAIQAILRSQVASALKGNAYAQKHYIDRYDRAEEKRRSKLEEDNALWQNYIDTTRAAITKAKAKKEPPPEPLPHPDDIIIDPKRGVRFTGPVTEAEVEKVRETCRFRDQFLLQGELDRRLSDVPVDADVLDRPETSFLFAFVLNDTVPARFRLNDAQIIWMGMCNERMSKRRLLKDVHRGWRALGKRIPRGSVFPPLREGKRLLERARAASDRLVDENGELIAYSLAETYGIIREVFGVRA